MRCRRQVASRSGSVLAGLLVLLVAGPPAGEVLAQDLRVESRPAERTERASTSEGSVEADDEFDARFDAPAAGSPPDSLAARLAAPSPYAPPSPPVAPPVSAPLFVPAPDQAAARARRRRDRWGPEVQPGARVAATLMPFVGDASGGLFSLAWRYQTPHHLWVGGRLGPLGVARAAPDTIGVFDSLVQVGVAFRLVGFSLGGGVAYVRIEEPLRRTHGLAPTYAFALRIGARYGFHVALTGGGALVQGEGVASSSGLRVRVPLGHRDLLDIDTTVAEGMSWLFLGAAYERGLGDRERSRLRIRPHVGLVEVIDPVGRDGGAGFSVGVALVWRSDGPIRPSSPTFAPAPQAPESLPSAPARR